jgi:hypothetical protein
MNVFEQDSPAVTKLLFVDHATGVALLENANWTRRGRRVLSVFSRLERAPRAAPVTTTVPALVSFDPTHPVTEVATPPSARAGPGAHDRRDQYHLGYHHHQRTGVLSLTLLTLHVISSSSLSLDSLPVCPRLHQGLRSSRRHRHP